MRKVLLIIAAILLPPLAVGLVVGLSAHFWINIILMIVTLDVGAIIHALYLVLTRT
ncbi:MAG: YqaE/Pmp3 family membrane protein [Phycisphaeraceae bacterium]